MFLEKELKKPIDLLLYIKEKSNYLTGATLCFKAEVKKMLLPFPELSSLFHDEWMALVLASRNTLYYSTEKLISYRTHANQQIGAIKAEKVARSTKIARIIFNLEQTNNFKLLFKIYKNYHRNYKKFKQLNDLNPNITAVNVTDLVDYNIKRIKETENKLKKANFIRFYINKFIDFVRKKRQL